MKRDVTQDIGTAKRLHESLFSMNIGFAITYALFAYASNWYLPVYGSRHVRTLLIAFGAFLLRIAPLRVDIPPGARLRSTITWEAGFVILMLGLALFCFVLVRLSSRVGIGRLVLHSLAGVTALIAVPGCWFYIVEITRPGSGLRETFWSTYGALFVLEIAASGGVLYLVRERPIWWGTLVFAAHYVLWVLVMGGLSGAPCIASAVLSPVFPLSGVAWLLYTRMQRVRERQ